MALSLNVVNEQIEKKLKDQDAKFNVILEKQLNDQHEKYSKLIKKLQADNNILEKRVSTLEKDIVVAFKDLETTKRATFANDQYQRRNNVEFSGIPESIVGDNLEEVCIDLINNICSEPGVPSDTESLIGKFDIEACHRIHSKDKNNVKNTIIRFINRTVCEDILSNKKKIKEVKMDILGSEVNNIYVNENLCSYYKDLSAKCRRLKKRKKITDTWIKNGIVRIKLLNDNIKIITHQSDLDFYFPDFVYFGND